MGRRSRRRAGREAAPAATTDYRDAEGNVLTLRDALLINPYDVEDTAEAIHTAVTLSAEDRRSRMARMRGQVREHNIYGWAGLLLADLIQGRENPWAKLYDPSRKGGLGTFAPPLDQAGNSVKGQLAATFLSERLGLSLFASAPEADARRECLTPEVIEMLLGQSSLR